jgi:hypothetical protein
MLGPLGNTPIHHCVLFDQADRPIQMFLADHNLHQPLQRFIAKNFPWNELPFRIEVRHPSDPDRVEVRYL